MGAMELMSPRISPPAPLGIVVVVGSDGRFSGRVRGRYRELKIVFVIWLHSGADGGCMSNRGGCGVVAVELNIDLAVVVKF